MSGPLKGFGVCLTCRLPVREIVGWARTAESYGIGSLWVNESHYYRSAFSALSAVAVSTEKIALGTAVVSVFGRHPALLAMEAATLDELSGGRLLLGLGATPVWGDPSPLREGERPLRALREATEIVRGLLARELKEYHGRAFTMVPSDHWSETGTSLNFPPLRKRLPLYFGVKGPKLLRLAGAIADGVILTNPSPLPYVQQCIGEIQRGAEAAGRDLSDFTTAAFITFSIGEDRRMAREATREMLATYVDHVGEGLGPFLGLSGEELDAYHRAFQSGGVKAAAPLVTEDLIDRLAVAGGPEECLERLLAYREAGLDLPIAFHTLGPDRARALRLIGERLVPKLT